MDPSPASYDLHLHTCWSYDALAEPEDYFRRAKELGVRCLAITEHHNMDSACEVADIATRYPGIRWIRAAELSVHTSFGSVDLLCYGLPGQPEEPLKTVLAEYHQWQNTAGAVRIEALQFLGFDYDVGRHQRLLQDYRPARVRAKQGLTPVGGPMEQVFLLEHGYIKTPAERQALQGRLPAHLDFPPYPAVARVVSAVKQAGALVVLAHPGLYLQGCDRSRLDALREECDLDGIECAHPLVNPELSAFCRAYCREHRLLSTAGSDCHRPDQIATPPAAWGYSKEAHFAAHMGERVWLDEFLERLGNQSA